MGLFYVKTPQLNTDFFFCLSKQKHLTVVPQIGLDSSNGEYIWIQNKGEKRIVVLLGL